MKRNIAPRREIEMHVGMTVAILQSEGAEHFVHAELFRKHYNGWVLASSLEASGETEQFDRDWIRKQLTYAGAR